MSGKQKNFTPRFTPKRRAISSVSTLVERAIGAHHLNQKLEQYAAFPRWREVVGDEIADIALPEKITRSNVLVVRVLDAVWAQELSLNKTSIIEKIAILGEGAVIEDIQFLTGSPNSFRKDTK